MNGYFLKLVGQTKGSFAGPSKVSVVHQMYSILGSQGSGQGFTAWIDAFVEQVRTEENVELTVQGNAPWTRAESLFDELVRTGVAATNGFDLSGAVPTQ